MALNMAVLEQLKKTPGDTNGPLITRKSSSSSYTPKELIQMSQKIMNGFETLALHLTDSTG